MLDDKKILIVEDDERQRHDIELLVSFLGEHSLALSYSSWGEAKQQLCEESIAMIILGNTTSEDNLHNHLTHIYDCYGMCPVVLVGNYDEVNPKWEPSLRHMVIGRLTAPIAYNKLVDTMYRAQRLNIARLSKNDSQLGRPTHLFRSLVGTSREVHHIREMMGQVADKDVTVLILGESGTGKEVVARNLHYNSPRRQKPFVPVNCGAIPAELLESELFGHEKGAFTGAISARAGRFELAEGGTLFLDEIGDMPLHMQVKILRVLQERSYERVGGNKSYPTDVRIVAATHRNLESMIAEGKFREDLYYRLNVFPIDMPSLENRSEDIPLLINELVSRLESEKRGSIRFNSSAIMSLCQHRWPGNVRELANLVERMAIMQPYGVVGLQDLPVKYRHIEIDNEPEDEMLETLAKAQAKPTIVGASDIPLLPEDGIDLKQYITNLEKNLIQQALDDTGGVVARAAEKLSIRRTTLVEKMRKYDLQRA